MPVTSASIAVGTTITIVSQPENNSKYIYLQSGTKDAKTYVGGPNVSSANGMLLSETSPLVLQTRAKDTVYAVSDLAGAVVRVVEVK